MGNTTDIDSKTGKNANDILLQVVGFFGYAISRPNECIQNGSVAWLPPSAEASPAKFCSHSYPNSQSHSYKCLKIIINPNKLFSASNKSKFMKMKPN